MLYYLSIAIIISSNVFYHLASKKVPANTNPFFFVMISYIVGFVFASTAFIMTVEEKNITKAIVEQSRIINWTPIVLGISVIGLEIGNVMMYRAGWDVSKGALFCNALLAILLVVIGVFIFKESFTTRHIVGLMCCAVGLYFLV